MPHGDTATKTVLETLIQSRSPWGSDGGDGAVLSPAPSKPCQHLLSMLRTSPACLCTQNGAGRALGCGGRPRELGQAAEPAALLDLRELLQSWSRRESPESPHIHPAWRGAVPTFIILIFPAHPHHSHPSCSPSPSSVCPFTLTILSLSSHRPHPALSLSPSSSSPSSPCPLTLTILILPSQWLCAARSSSATQMKKAFLFYGAQGRAGTSVGLFWGTAKAGLS